MVAGGRLFEVFDRRVAEIEPAPTLGTAVELAFLRITRADGALIACWP
jgi:hypothetical protein